jgi:hypothetical protein
MNVFHLQGSLHIHPSATVESDHNVASALLRLVALQK